MAHIDNLKKMTREQLVELALKQGLPKPHHKANEATIIKSIVDSMTPQTPQNKATEQHKQPNEVRNTAETILMLLDRLRAERPSITWELDEYEETLTVKNAHAAVSFNWHIPLRVMERHIRLHVFNPTRPLGLNHHFDEMPSASGKNAYTNTVLA